MLFVQILAIAQTPANSHIPKPRLREVYENADGTFNWYVIDTLRFNSTTLIQDKYFNTYLLPREVNIDTLSMKKLFSQPDLYIVELALMDSASWIMFFTDFEETMRFDSYIPPHGTAKRFMNSEIIQWSKKKDFCKFRYSSAPCTYILFLMAGKAFNFMTFDNIMFDLVNAKLAPKPIKFPDENAFYRILVPIWAKD